MRAGPTDTRAPSDSHRSGRLYLAFLLAAGLLCVAWSVRGLAAAWVAGSPGPQRVENLQRALAITPENWRYRIELADLLSAFGQFDASADQYRRAIDWFPGCGRCWMGLAEAEFALGRDPRQAIENATRFERSNTAVRLRAGTLYQRMGLTAEAAAEFSDAKGGLHDELHRFYRVLHRLYDVQYMLDHVVTPEDTSRYFAFACRELSLAEVDAIWASRPQVHGEDWAGRFYVRRLLDAGQVRRAATVYAELTGEVAFGVLDGDFEYVRDRRPFGWRIEDGEGVKAAVVPCPDCDSGKLSLRLSFDGRENPRYTGVWQEIALMRAGEFELHARIRTREITSPNGPFLRLQGMGPKGGEEPCALHLDSPGFRLSVGWHDYILPFRLPEGCQGVRLRIVRESSKAFDKVLSGEFWMDDVRVLGVGDAGSGA